MMRTTVLRSLLAGSALTLLACSGADDASLQTPAQDVPARPTLESASRDAVAPRTAQMQSDLKSEVGPGFLTPERINDDPALSGPTLRRPAISPDGSLVTVLRGRADDANQQDLWAYDLSDPDAEPSLLVSSTDLLGETVELSEEEKNRRERAREYGRGIIDYRWIDASTLLFPLGGDVFLFDLDSREATRVTDTDGFETDTKVTADGRTAVYVRDNDLYATTLATGTERKLTSGSSDTVRNGIASFVVQEELGRATGFWPSPDGSLIAYTQIDESPIAVTTRTEIGADGVKTIDQRYPFAGTPNATWRLGVVPIDGGRTRWLDLDRDGEDYLTRVAWSPDGQTVYVGLLSRDQRDYRIVGLNLRSGQLDTLHTQTSQSWINIEGEFTPNDDGLIITAETPDTKQVLQLTHQGTTPLTPEGLNVNSLLCATEDAVFVSGWQDSPLERHVFRVAGGEATQLTSGEGRHSARFSEDCSRYIGTFSSPDQPFQTRVFAADGTPGTWLNENALDADHPYAPYLDTHITPEFGQIEAADGTPLDYALYKPLDLSPGQRRASVTIVYGGPGVQRVHKGWERRELARTLAHHGFVVFLVDGRGATNRGQDFESPLNRALGRAEVEDQIAGAEWLKSQDFIDPDRMGVYGWSYGGYMTLMMLGQTDLYRAGVSGAPVTDWTLYDTAYTERYLGDPNPEAANYTEGAYERGNVLAHLDGLTEPVLVIHGMADDNVVFDHTVKFVDAMQRRGRHNVSLNAYPGEKHGFRAKSAKTHRDRAILEFFLDHLSPERSG